MDLCEHESRLMNYQMEESHIAKLIYEECPKFKLMNEATAYISELKKGLTSFHVEKRGMQIQVQDLQNQVKNLEQTKVSIHSLFLIIIHIGRVK